MRDVDPILQRERGEHRVGQRLLDTDLHGQAPRHRDPDACGQGFRGKHFESAAIEAEERMVVRRGDLSTRPRADLQQERGRRPLDERLDGPALEPQRDRVEREHVRPLARVERGDAVVERVHG